MHTRKQRLVHQKSFDPHPTRWGTGATLAKNGMRERSLYAEKGERIAKKIGKGIKKKTLQRCAEEAEQALYVCHDIRERVT